MKVRLDGSTDFNTFSPSKTTRIGYYKFLVGYETIAEENFNNGSAWVSGYKTDSSTTGQWELAIPQETYFIKWGYGFLMQPTGNHDGDSLKCWVTGAEAYTDTYDVIEHCPDALTSVVSPVYNINGFLKPTLNLFYWFYSFRIGGQNPGSVSFNIEASTDTGVTWSRIMKTSTDSTDWIEYASDLTRFNTPGTGIMFKISVNPDGKYFSTSHNKYYPVFISKSLFDGFKLIGIPQQHIISAEETPQYSDRLAELTVFPNPMSDVSNISFKLNEPARVIARVYSILGEEVAIVKDDYLTAGYSIFSWNGITHSGAKATPGIYQLVISAGDKTYSSKIVVE
jgi:hypothetical protein